MFHYTACGLDNVYLLNGVNFINSGTDQAAYSINDLEELYIEITNTLVDATLIPSSLQRVMEFYLKYLQELSPCSNQKWTCVSSEDPDRLVFQQPTNGAK